MSIAASPRARSSGASRWPRKIMNASAAGAGSSSRRQSFNSRRRCSATAATRSGKAGSISRCFIEANSFEWGPGRTEGREGRARESSADAQRRVHPDRPAQVEVIGRGLDHRLVDLLELVARAVALDADLVIDRFIARSDGVAEAEEAAQVELPAGADFERF